MLDRALRFLKACLREGMEWPDAEYCVRDRYSLKPAEWAEVVERYDSE